MRGREVERVKKAGRGEKNWRKEMEERKRREWRQR